MGDAHRSRPIDDRRSSGAPSPASSRAVLTDTKNTPIEALEGRRVIWTRTWLLDNHIRGRKPAGSTRPLPSEGWKGRTFPRTTGRPSRDGGTWLTGGFPGLESSAEEAA